MSCRGIQGKFERILDGRALPGDERIVEVHLERCSKCRAHAVLVDRAHRVLARIEPADISRSLSERAFKRAIAAAHTVRASVFDDILPSMRRAVAIAAALALLLAARAWLVPPPAPPPSARSDPLELLSQFVLPEVDAELANDDPADGEER